MLAARQTRLLCPPYIHYQKGHKTREQAFKDAGKSIAVHAGTGAVVGIGVTIAIGLEAGPIIATLADGEWNINFTEGY